MRPAVTVFLWLISLRYGAKDLCAGVAQMPATCLRTRRPSYRGDVAYEHESHDAERFVVQAKRPRAQVFPEDPILTVLGDTRSDPVLVATFHPSQRT